MTVPLLLNRPRQYCGKRSSVDIAHHTVRGMIFAAAMIFVATACVFYPGGSYAQDTDTQNAKNSFDEGQNLYLQAKYAEAAEQFKQAYASKPFPAFLFNIAVCYEKNEDYQQALKYYEQFFEADRHSRDRDLVQKRIIALRTYLNPPTPKSEETTPPIQPEKPKLAPVKTKGLVVIESSPEGAAIYLEDKKNGVFTRTPYTGSLPPGRHTVILELKEFQPVRKTVFVRHDRLTYLYFALTPQRNLGWIEVKGNIPNAQVFLDRRSFGAVGRTPYSGHLRPGERTLIIEREGYVPLQKKITIIAGKTHVVDFNLERVKFGWLMVTGSTTQGAKIIVDGKPFTCTDHPCRGETTTGKHTVRVEREGFKPYEAHVTVNQAEEIRVRVRLEPKPSRLKAYISFGMAAALLGGGIAAGVISTAQKDALEKDIEQRVLFESEDSRLNKGKITAIVANSLFALSGVAAILGVYYLFRKVGPDSRGDTVDRQIAVTPLLGPQTAGVAGAWRF